MPASTGSLQITDAYRVRLGAIRERIQGFAAQRWPSIEELDSTDWPERVAPALAQAQTEAVRVSTAYLTAYLTSELGQRTRGPAINSGSYAGFSRDGRLVSESLVSPIVGVLKSLKDGQTPAQALSAGLTRAQRMVETDLMHAARESLREGLEKDPRIEGWQRSVRGSCGACLGDVAVEVSVQLPSLPLHIHPNCQCVTQPVVTGVPNRFPLATGAERFARMSKEEQDEGLGPEAAEKVRTGELALQDLVGESHLETADDFITQRPLEEVATISTP